MIEYFLGGVFLTILLIFFIRILYTEYNKRNVEIGSCKVDRYIIQQCYDIVVVRDRLIGRDICRFEIKDTKLAKELAELCIKRIGGCEDD